jgi:hypothetical protein
MSSPVYEGALHGLALTHQDRLKADLLAFARATLRGGNMMTSDHSRVSITVLDDEESARERRLRMGGLRAQLTVACRKRDKRRQSGRPVQ